MHLGSATRMANRHCAYGSAARCPRLAHGTLQAFVRPSPTASPIRDRPSGRGARLPFPLLLSFPLSRSLSLSFSLALSLSLIYIYTEREIYFFFFSLSPSADLYAKLSFVPLLAPLRDAPPDGPTTIHPPSVHLPRLSATAPPVQSGDCGLLGLPTCTAPSLTGTCPAERISPSPLLSYCVITQRWPQACETVPLTPGQRGVSSAVCF